MHDLPSSRDHVGPFEKARYDPGMKNLPANQSKALYALIREILVARDGEKCLRCGRQDKLQMSHIYPKGRYRSMEYMDLNIKFLCFPCHFFFWHRNPIEAHEWLNTVLSKERLDKLKLMANTYMGKFDWKLHKLYLENELKKYRKNT